MLSITKLQNLKAIHNLSCCFLERFFVVINHKTTKFESNSQHEMVGFTHSDSCYQSQNYKIWKQFTTNKSINGRSETLLSITKLQNLKAIHNKNLQLFFLMDVVINHKTTKFESNSQPMYLAFGKLCCSYQSQNYKIWKQFTTAVLILHCFLLLLWITKLQNLKAIHNRTIRYR